MSSSHLHNRSRITGRGTSCDIETKLIESLFEPNVNLQAWVRRAEAFISQNGGRTCHGTTASSLTDSDCGDMNNDGGTNVLDIVMLANCVLAGNCDTLENGCAGDMNNDGGWNVLDVVALANCVLANNCSDHYGCGCYEQPPVPGEDCTDSEYCCTAQGNTPPGGCIYDCNGTCARYDWLGDGICDAGVYTWDDNCHGSADPFYIAFNCPELGMDAGECSCTQNGCAGWVNYGCTCDSDDTANPHCYDSYECDECYPDC